MRPFLPRALAAILCGLSLCGALQGQAIERHTLLPSAPTTQPQSGGAVDIDGDVAVVGEAGDDALGGNAGAARVHEWQGTGWVEVAKLTAPNGAAGDLFGLSVAVSGDRIVVGAQEADRNGVDSGAAYLFEKIGGVWTYVLEFFHPNPQAYDNFGNAVDIDGSVVIVGALWDDTAVGANAGSAFVFRKKGFAWDSGSALTGSASTAGEEFGLDVAVDGDTAVVGVPRDDTGGTDRGAAYVFVYDSATKLWTEQDHLVPSLGTAGDYLGAGVAVSGDRVLLGAPWADTLGTNSGEAWMFERTGTVWSEHPSSPLLAEGGSADDRFGRQVALEGSVALIGSRLDDHAGGTDAGTARLFRLCPVSGLWYEDYACAATWATTGDWFGTSVNLDAGQAIIGSPFDSQLATYSGAAAIYSTAPLALRIEPPDVTAGQVATLTSFVGRPGQLVALFVREVDGTPFNLLLLIQQFSANHEAAATGSVPPALAGIELGFESFTLKPCGQIVASNLLLHTF